MDGCCSGKGWSRTLGDLTAGQCSDDDMRYLQQGGPSNIDPDTKLSNISFVIVIQCYLLHHTREYSIMIYPTPHDASTNPTSVQDNIPPLPPPNTPLDPPQRPPLRLKSLRLPLLNPPLDPSLTNSLVQEQELTLPLHHHHTLLP